jgi:hypothetical protein
VNDPGSRDEQRPCACIGVVHATVPGDTCVLHIEGGCRMRSPLVIVVADASPLRADASPLWYLILIEHTHVLPALYGEVIAPAAMVTELNQARAPDRVRTGCQRGRTGYASRLLRRHSDSAT